MPPISGDPVSSSIRNPSAEMPRLSGRRKTSSTRRSRMGQVQAMPLFWKVSHAASFASGAPYGP